eukprot:225693_1
MDVGGYYVNFLCNKMFNNKTRKLLMETNGKWGDIIIDNIFIDILNKIFNIKSMNKFKCEYPNKYLGLLNNFRNGKLSFYCYSEWHNINIPIEFIKFMKKELNI